MAKFYSWWLALEAWREVAHALQGDCPLPPW